MRVSDASGVIPGLVRFRATGGAAARADFACWGPGRIDVTHGGTRNPTTVPDLFHLQTDALRTRPPRALIWVLTTYVTSLVPPADEGAVNTLPPAFIARCAGCQNPERAFGGDLVEASALVGPTTVADDPERGTGLLKVPPLRGVARNAPYMHDGRHAALPDVLDAGHPFGEPLPRDVRAE